MDCIKDFLSDSYQYRLRLLAQSKSERYEDTIENYKKIFIAHFELVKKGYCNKCNDEPVCIEVKNVLKEIEITEIESFFDDLKKIYLLWIDSKVNDAIEYLGSILKKKDLLSFRREVGDFKVYFKGRISEQVLTSWDMFHIPFNKRYLIQNQRYSLTGQPMLYIGSSVVDVAEEIETNDIDKLKLSVVSLLSKDLKIYDLRCNIYEIFDSIWLDIFLQEKISYNKATFFKMILSSVCSFQKRQELKGYSFCEEYVLPQLLALVLKNEQFNGIAYYSTKYYKDVTYEDMIEGDMDFKENMAIFTNINTEHVYDKELYDKLFISVPIDRNKIYTVSLKDLEEVKKEIVQCGQQKKITRAEIIYSSFERIYGKMLIEGKKYIESEYGKLHMYEIYTVLNQILVE
ncbi:MAG: hypothetical protein IJD58_09995 [Lachnospiraceae bacterium]|nr:hypothetical protein [Lachnospiraceae bacterium]